MSDLQSDLRQLRQNAQLKGFADRRRSSANSSGSRKTLRIRGSVRYTNKLDCHKVWCFEKNSFRGTAVRNPITGQVRLEAVDDFLDFAFVDLWTRPSLTGTPDQLDSDRYMMKPRPLLYRTWIFHGLQDHAEKLENEGIAEDDEADPAVLQALKASCIDAPVGGGRWSPVMVLAPQLFPVVLVGEFSLMFVCLFTFLFCLFVAVQANHHEYYRAQRLITFPVRLIFLSILFNSVSVSALLQQGKIINVIGYVVAACMTMIDLCMGDGVALLCRSLEVSYEPIRELPHSVWVCRKSNGGGGATGGSSSMQDKRDRVTIDKGIVGVHNWDECTDLCLIADVQGLLVELVKPNKDEWNAFFNQYRKTGHPVKYMSQESFNVMKQTIEDVEDPTRRLKNPKLMGHYLVSLADGRLAPRHQVDSGEIALEDYDDEEDA